MPDTKRVSSLLDVLAQSLDLQEIFAQLSELAQQTVPHDLLHFALVTEDHTRIRLIALSEPLPVSPLEVPLSEQARDSLEVDAAIVHHVRDRPGSVWTLEGLVWNFAAANDGPWMWQPDPGWKAILDGHQSWLRLRVSLRGGVLGFLNFFSRHPNPYSEADLAPARRIADLVGLAFAHERLAQEQRRHAEAREREARLEARVERLKAELEAVGGYRAMGASKPWHDVLAQATKVAATETTVLLTGESGTGKEVVARLIHRGSRRAEGPFVAINCAALPETVLESELFGHERGAFTGAVTAHPGRLEQAAGGTLFLDEVGEMSTAVQAKLLRVLETREFQRLGGTRQLTADVRFIAATNRDLEVALAKGVMREDLYYRLQVFAIHLPPLRERRQDIVTLLDHFVAQIGSSVLGRPAAGVSAEAREQLLAYDWPGNVRELRNAVERALILCEGGLITPEHLPLPRHAPPSGPSATVLEFPTTGVTLEGTERAMIERALRQAGHNKSKAARILGLSRGKLYTRMQRHGLG